MYRLKCVKFDTIILSIGTIGTELQNMNRRKIGEKLSREGFDTSLEEKTNTHSCSLVYCKNVDRQKRRNRTRFLFFEKEL